MSRRKATPGDYEVGYGKPPAATRFRPGQSGNPRGRPKKSKNLRTMLEEELNEPTVVVSNGRRRTVPFMQVVIKQLKTQVAGGSLKAIEAIFRIVERYDFDREQVASWFSKEQDEAIIKAYLSRRRSADDNTGGQSDAT